jgi:hypothetical protein
MKHLGAGLLGVIALVIGASSADALVLCVNASGGVVALDQCKAGMTPLAPAAVGLVGPAGPAGPQGPAGPAGAVGPAGANPVYYVAQGFQETIYLSLFITLDLPAGTFLVTGKTYITSAAYGGCNLVTVPAIAPTFYDRADYNNGSIDFPAVMVSKITLAAPGTVAIRCGNGFGENWSSIDSVLFAVPVAP